MLNSSYVKDNEIDYIFKIIFVGDSSVGKSNIISRFYNNSFKNDSMTTIGVELFTKIFMYKNEENNEEKKVKVQIWDTAGQERFKSITSSYYKGAKGAFIVYDISKEKTFDDIKYWYKDIKTFADNNDILIMLLGNKSDLENERKITTKEAKKEAELNNMLFLETSAKNGNGIEDAFKLLINKLCDLHINFGLNKDDNNEEDINFNNMESIDIDKQLEIENKKKCC